MEILEIAVLPDDWPEHEKVQSLKKPPKGWRGGHYNRACLFAKRGFVQYAARLNEPFDRHFIGIMFLQLFESFDQPAGRWRRQVPQYLKTFDPFFGAPITVGFDPLTGNMWVADGHHDLKYFRNQTLKAVKHEGFEFARVVRPREP